MDTSTRAGRRRIGGKVRTKSSGRVVIACIRYLHLASSIFSRSDNLQCHFAGNERAQAREVPVDRHDWAWRKPTSYSQQM